MPKKNSIAIFLAATSALTIATTESNTLNAGQTLVISFDIASLQKVLLFSLSSCNACSMLLGTSIPNLCVFLLTSKFLIVIH